MSVSWVPAVTAIIAVGGTAFAYWNQKRIDRREALISQRRDVYQRAMEALFEHVETQAPYTRSAYDRIKCELLLVSSDSVLKELALVQEAFHMDGVALGPQDLYERVTLLFKAMRKDCFEATNLSDWNIEYLVPIGRPTPIKPIIEDDKET